MGSEKVNSSLFLYNYSMPKFTIFINLQLLFRLEQPHGTGDVYLEWQKGSGMYLATTGVDSIVNIFDRYGEIQDRIKLQRY